jgi:hypothetical protein
MRRLSLWVAFIGIALAVPTTNAHAGGTYHHADPVFFKTVDKQPISSKPVEQKAHHQAPVSRRSPHRHHH